MPSLFNTRILLPLLTRAQQQSARPWPLAQLASADIKRILVISSTAIGDTLLSTPAIHALRQRFPAARLIGLLHRRTADLFRYYRELDEIVLLRRSLLRTAWRLRRTRPDVAVILHGNEPEAAMLAYLSGARFVLKHPKRHPAPQFLSRHDGDETYDPLMEHAIVNRLRLAGWLAAKTNDTRMRLDIPPGTEASAAQLLRAHGVGVGEICIGFQPGAATRYKMWPATSFMLLAHRLMRHNPGFKILLLGSGREWKLCEEIKTGVRDYHLINLASAIDLPVLPALVNRLALLVTNDTGTMHVAIALGIPTVSLFASTEPGGVGPIQDLERHRVIKKPQTCSPCVTKHCTTPFCMDQITVDEVFRTVLSHGALSGAAPIAQMSTHIV
jgi:ADP-heptose:LPS heptosyltransferase